AGRCPGVGGLRPAAARGGGESRHNAAAMRGAVGALAAARARAREGGGPAARERHLGRGKLLARERIARLVDLGAPFLELSELAAWGMYDHDVPSAGIVTGVGRVAGREGV